MADEMQDRIVRIRRFADRCQGGDIAWILRAYDDRGTLIEELRREREVACRAANAAADVARKRIAAAEAERDEARARVAEVEAERDDARAEHGDEIRDRNLALLEVEQQRDEAERICARVAELEDALRTIRDLAKRNLEMAGMAESLRPKLCDRNVRDPENPCEAYEAGEPRKHADCEGDGHYLCAGCRERAAEKEE